MKHIIFLSFVLFASFFFLMQVDAQQQYILYKDNFNHTSVSNVTAPWNLVTSGGRFNPQVSGAFLSFTGTSPNEVIKTVRNFFFNVPFNRTYMSYLGATQPYIVFNWTVKPNKNSNTCAGACTIVQEGKLTFSNADHHRGQFTDDAADDLVSSCGTIQTTQSSGQWTNQKYNFTLVMNYTTLTSNITTQASADGSQKNTKNCLDVIEANTELDMNVSMFLSATGVSGSGVQVDIDDLKIYLNMDADYFNGGNSYTNLSTNFYISDRTQFGVNITAPVVVNASYKINNGTFISLFNNSRYLTTNLNSANHGQNNVTFNFTFNKNETTFSVDETIPFYAGNTYAACDDNIQGIDRTAMIVNFYDEKSYSAVASNFTLKLFENSLADTFYNTTRVNNQTFSLCFINNNFNKRIGYELTYKSANGNYPERIVGTVSGDRLSINITNPPTVPAYLLSSTDGTTITFTVKDSLSVVQPNMRLEAYRYVNTTTILFADREDTDGNGVAQMLLELNQKYKIIVRDPNGAQVLDTGFFTVSQTSYTLTIGNTPDPIIRTTIAAQGIPFTLLCEPGHTTFCNKSSSQLVNATWNARALTITQACIDVSNKTNLNYFSIINMTCVSADAGTILFNFTQLNNTLLSVRFYVTMFNSSTTLPLLNYTLATIDIDLIADYLKWGFLGLFIFVTVMLTVVGAVALNSVTLTIISVMIGTFLLNLLEIIALGWSTTVGIVFLGALLLYWLRDAG